jgi:hypothetical protein
MRESVECELPAGYDGTAILERLAQVLDPELDESILDLALCVPCSCVLATPALSCNCPRAGAR